MYGIEIQWCILFGLIFLLVLVTGWGLDDLGKKIGKLNASRDELNFILRDLLSDSAILHELGNLTDHLYEISEKISKSKDFENIDAETMIKIED